MKGLHEMIEKTNNNITKLTQILKKSLSDKQLVTIRKQLDDRSDNQKYKKMNEKGRFTAFMKESFVNEKKDIEKKLDELTVCGEVNQELV